jgi:BirA family biotin operon repressor/biotin-[acetyl-CoA-carboxylase] ligase
MTAGRLEEAATAARGRLGRPCRYIHACPSTQDLLRETGLPHGAVAIAEHQTAGRGRTGRRWDDEPGAALLCSVLLRPARPGPLPQLSLVAALATARSVEEATGLDTLVKWPNDVLLAGRKVAGILLEAWEDAVVAGIGINVNQAADRLPIGGRPPAASLRTATGREHDRAALLTGLLERLDESVARWERSGLAELLPELERRNALRGRRVRASEGAGKAGAIAPDGRLEVALEGGGVLLVGSGEISLV